MIFNRIKNILDPFSDLTKIAAKPMKSFILPETFFYTAFACIRNGVRYDQTYMKGYLESLESWSDKTKFICKTNFFFCEKFKIAEHCDMYLTDDGSFVLFELTSYKTRTQSLYASACLYLARKAGYNVKSFEFIELQSDGKYPNIYRYDENFELFLSCLEVYNYLIMESCKNFDLDFA